MSSHHRHRFGLKSKQNVKSDFERKFKLVADTAATSSCWWNEHMAWDVVKKRVENCWTHKKRWLSKWLPRNSVAFLCSELFARCLMTSNSRFVTCRLFSSSTFFSTTHFTLDTSIDYHTRLHSHAPNHKQFSMLSTGPRKLRLFLRTRARLWAFDFLLNMLLHFILYRTFSSFTFPLLFLLQTLRFCGFFPTWWDTFIVSLLFLAIADDFRNKNRKDCSFSFFPL